MLELYVAASRVSRKWLASIPAEVRKALGIEDGDTLIWVVGKERGQAIVRVAKNPLRRLEGKYNDPRIVYDSVEEQADEVAAREAHAGNRARHADSACQQSQSSSTAQHPSYSP